ncbi:hypothetical protein CMUST_01150 [Corynebacterium mustelae]|uniref:HNH endonuclease n=1 Tax=Corynebacterium mustelae TaxID=571915 RepID=A0A0G3GVL4_9CORY|nr:HNH endonuclease signature motif containing protein [Corynebacterium mustelae]AKK04580.1 hypothetical protein CMUST_01150 [Corynebacterium mustelae]
MAWVKVGDTFNSAPEWMSAAALAISRQDIDLVVKLKGYTIALYTQSAIAWSDYIINYGTAVTVIGMHSANQVISDLCKIGILTPIDADDEDNPRWKLLEREDFINVIKSNERFMRTKRRRDRANASLVVRVLLRDGEECRYCGVEVKWGDNKSDDGQTFDHRDPEAPTTPDNYVQCCRGCNRLRAEFANPDDELPLLAQPEYPEYGPGVLKVLRKWTSVTARICRELGIPNPLTRNSVSETDTSVLTASEATETSIPTTHSPVLSGSQPETEPQLPEGASPRQVEAANEKPRHVRRGRASSTAKAQGSYPSSSPVLSGSQSETEPRRLDSASVRAGDGANGGLGRVQSRRRKGRRRR